MQNPFNILGIPPNASMEDAKAAYRRLASKLHPDKGGDTQKFQELQTAWVAIEREYSRPTGRFKPASTSPPNPQPRASQTSFNDMYQSMMSHGRGAGATIHIKVPPVRPGGYSFVEFKGKSFLVPGPVPNGWYGIIGTDPDSLMPGEKPTEMRVQTEVICPHDPNMQIQGLYANSTSFVESMGRMAFTSFIGDCVTKLETNAINLILGGWFDIKDLFGQNHKFRIPSGFDPSRRLRVAGAGYYKWDSLNERMTNERADLIIELIPKFTAIDKFNDNELAAFKAAGEMNE